MAVLPGDRVLVVGGRDFSPSSFRLTSVYSCCRSCSLSIVSICVHNHVLLDAYLWASAVSHASTRLVNFVYVLMLLQR